MAGGRRLSATAFLGLGSNIGDRRGHLEAAVSALREHDVDVLASSSVYETEPVGLVLDQPEFLNACLRARVQLGPLGPEQLLDACKAVERSVGRKAGEARHAPRVIDVDLLLLGDLEYASQRLTLPHAEVRSRRFVLMPLLELDPGLSLPPSGEPLSALLDALGPRGQAVRLAGPPLV
ncbi:MAG: 2-amino-4-hydroxy-6-hydroxymethyldihydropteridine diphosphokinase [Solirubrobacteraceae bacterium]